MTRGGTTVLVVEDEPLIRLSICDDLIDLGFQVIEANDASMAIELLMLHPEIQVMFTDIDMPGDMNGLKLAALVATRWPPIKIIITSGKHVLHSDELPVAGRFISKPYEAQFVAATIGELLAA